MKETRKPLKRKGGGFNIYGSEGPEYIDVLTALRTPVPIWSIDVVLQATAHLAVEALELFMKYFDLFVDAQRFIDQHPNYRRVLCRYWRFGCAVVFQIDKVDDGWCQDLERFGICGC